MLTQKAIEAIQNAKHVYGSTRALALAKEHIRGESTVLESYDLRVEHDACILSTGDPMFSGLGGKAPQDAEIIPGISSWQLACARLKVDATNIVAVSTHGKEPTQSKKILEEVALLHKDLFVLADPNFDLVDICAYWANLGYDGEVVVLEDLGYETEKVSYGRIASPPKLESPLFCAVVRNLARKK
jgi:cobalt-precorrin-7 (C5)-methyltransferase